MGKGKQPAESFFVSLLLLGVGINAFSVGVGLMAMPDGRWLGMSTDWLNDSPFSNFFFPGLLLFIFLGLVPLLACWGLLFKPMWRWPQRFNIYNNKFWAWTYSLYSGLIFCIWIVAQQLMTDYFILQPIITAAGILVVILTLLPRVSSYYSN